MFSLRHHHRLSGLLTVLRKIADRVRLANSFSTAFVPGGDQAFIGERISEVTLPKANTPLHGNNARPAHHWHHITESVLCGQGEPPEKAGMASPLGLPKVTLPLQLSVRLCAYSVSFVSLW